MRRKQTLRLAPIMGAVLMSLAAMPSEAARGRRVLVDQLPGAWPGETTLDLTGDRNSVAVPLPGDMQLQIGAGVYRYVWVNENGFISLTPTATDAPEEFSDAQSWSELGGAVIAPYHADVRSRTPAADCANSALGNLCDVSYSTLDLRNEAPPENSPPFDHLLAMRVTWGYFGNDDADPALDPGVVLDQGAATDDTRRSSFQVKLIDRSDATGHEGDFDLQFNYDQLMWQSAGTLVGLQAGDVRIDFADFYDSFMGANPDSTAAEAIAACGSASAPDPSFDPSLDLPCNRITIEFRNGQPNLRTYTANLSTTLTGPTTPTHAAEQFPLSLRVLNAGDQTATNVSARIELPNGTTLVSSSPASADCVQVQATAVCQVGSVPADVPADMTLNLRSPENGPRNYSVTVDADQYDADETDNSVTAQITLASSADVSISTCNGPTSVVQGSVATLTCTVANAGPQAATAVVLQANLPANVSFSSGDRCSASGATVTCNAQSLAVNATTNFSITLNTLSSGTANVSATVSAAEFDPVSSGTYAATFSVSTPATPPQTGGSGGGGGGGGALSPLLLLLLLLRTVSASVGELAGRLMVRHHPVVDQLLQHR